MFISI